MNTALAIIPSSISSAVQPKPTKGEIITAMAMLHIEQVVKQNDESSKKKKTLGEKIHRLMIAAVRKDKLKTLKTHSDEGHKWRSDTTVSGAQLSVEFEEISGTELGKTLDEYHSLNRLVVPSLAEARKIIRDKTEHRAATDKRVETLLGNPASRKALEKSLHLIS